MTPAPAWNPGLYESKYAFVWERGRELLSLLDPQPEWRVLDVGCGTGRLTAEIARAGAAVTGIDSSPEMIAQARANYPALDFFVADVTTLAYCEEFDAVFSNAALHWVKDARAGARAMARALKPQGRLVAELGGRGNVARLLEALYGALESLGVADPAQFNPWFFPGVAEYATILEEQGLEVARAELFDRPTPLEGGEEGLSAWLEMFGTPVLNAIPREARPELVRRVAERAAPFLFRDGVWTIDYRRLRVLAFKNRRSDFPPSR